MCKRRRHIRCFNDFDRYAWSYSALENWIQQKEKQTEPCKNFQEKYK